MKLPSGNRHCLMLSGDADAIMYLRTGGKNDEKAEAITTGRISLLLF